MARAILVEERIFTTKAKAKEGRKLIEKLITMGKKGTLADKRRAFAVLCDHQMVKDLFENTAPRFKNRMGGYTRIIPFGNRRGDNAEMVYLELTEKSKPIISKRKLLSTVRQVPVDSAAAQDVATISDAEVKETKETKETKTKASAKADKKVNEESDKKTAPVKKTGGIRRLLKKKTEE
jgi:large subunit ribosomal protein L17